MEGFLPLRSRSSSPSRSRRTCGLRRPAAPCHRVGGCRPVDRADQGRRGRDQGGPLRDREPARCLEPRPPPDVYLAIARDSAPLVPDLHPDRAANRAS